jgi:hypothetical protein
MMTRATLLVLGLLLSSCSPLRQPAPPTVPQDSPRHRAALTPLAVFNHTDQQLTIAFRSATPPVQEVVLGVVPPAKRERLAPMPAGEPIILLARTTDGRELVLAARSFPLDDEWTWEISTTAVFRQP